jgi:hypothetical protein
MFRRNKKANGGSHDAEEEPGVVYYNGSQRQQQQQALYHEDRHDPQAMYQQRPQENGGKKKKGFGARIRGIVRRKKRRGSDDGESVGSHDVSVYSYDEPHQVPQDHYEESTEVQPLNDLPGSALDPNIMSRIVEETSEEEEDDSEDEEGVWNRSPVKAKSNHMISKKARELPMDSVINDHDDLSKGPSQVSFKESPNRKPPQKSSSVASMDTGSLSLVVLLVDPTTLRFELLQLEFPTPKEATVADVLNQIQDPMWRPLPFIGVIDRKGNAYKVKKEPKSKSNGSTKRSLFGKKQQQQTSTKQRPSPSLEQACQHRPPRKSRQEPHRDVLVGLLRDCPVEKTQQVARPILGEPKVVAMLEEHGYNLDGWKQDKQREATLQETRALPNNKRGKKTWFSSMSRYTIALLTLAAVVAAMIALGVSPSLFDPRKWNTAISSPPSIAKLGDRLPSSIPLLEKFRAESPLRQVPIRSTAAPVILTSNEDEAVEL